MFPRVTVKLALAAVILSMLGTGVQAGEDELSPFMAVKGRTSQPIGHHDFCLRFTAECDIRTRTEARVHLTAERWNEMVAINNWVNTNITPATDQEVYGVPEYWAYPTTRGDCEDLVLLKRRMLNQKGWPIGSLLITVVRQPNGDGHAVLTVLTDRGDLVLDNLDPHILVWSETGYQYIKRQSEFDTGEWVSIQDGRATEVGSLKN